MPLSLKGLRLVAWLLSSWWLGNQPAAAQNCLTDFYTLGTAVPVATTGCYRLTSQGVNTSAGAIWSPSLLRLDQDVDLSFTLTQCGQADGLVFVLQQAEPAELFGGVGNTMGYYQDRGVGPPSLGIELDLFTNSGAPYNDPSSPHVALALNHQPTPVLGPFLLPNLNDCAPHTFQVRWDHTAQQLRVFYQGQLLFTYAQDLVTRVFKGNPLVHVGWVGSTGALTATQTVCPGALVGTVVPTPLITREHTTLCAAGDDYAVLSVGRQPAGTTYQWSPTAGLDAATNARVFARPAVSTTYHVLVTSPAGCQRRDSARVEVLPRPAVQLSPRQVMCLGASVLLQARSPAAGLTHSWVPAPGLTRTTGDTVRATPSVTTLYTVTTTGPGYCTRQDTVLVVVRPAVQVRINAQLPTGPGGPTQLTAESPVAGLTYQWAPVADLNVPTGAQVLATPPATTTYTVTATDAGGCQVQASVAVRPYLLPNIITPNGDHHNDTFQVLVAAEPVTLQVYSRWGRLVFEQANYHDGWGAEGLAAGTYYYQLRTTSGQRWLGWLEVVR